MVLHTLLGIAQDKSMLGVRSRFNCLEELHECRLSSSTAPVAEQVPEMNRDQRNTETELYVTQVNMPMTCRT